MTPVEILIRISNLKQKEVAQKLNIHAQTLSQIKLGHREISINTFMLWCEILKISPIEVISTFLNLKEKTENHNNA